MIKSIVSVVVLFSTLTAAGGNQVNYAAGSPLPSDLKVLIEEELRRRCSSEIHEIREIETALRMDEIDQGQADAYYHSVFSAVEYFDGTHPVGVQISVDSAEYAISNPTFERMKILSISSSPQEVCKQ